MSKSTVQPPKSGGYFSTLAADLPASLVVFLVALPLSLGIALASGAPLMGGIIAAIVGGVVIGLLGGAPLQVSGPAAGLTVMVYEYVQRFGWGATCAITVGAGLLQLALGAAGVAPIALGISPAVIHALLAAIGILIALSQAHVVLGAKPHGEGLKNLMSLPESFLHMNSSALMLGLITIAILVVWPKLPARLRAFPAALAAVVIATLVCTIMGLDVKKVELGGSLLASIKLPGFPEGNIVSFIAAVMALCFVASAESLLSAVATDKLHTGPRANLNKELMAQGVGNALSGMLGGLPVTGVIVRSTTNISAGAKSQLSAIFHGVWVLLFVCLLPSVLALVPLAALAGLLVFTGLRLVNVGHIRELARRGEIWIYAVTLVAVVATGLLEGLGIGLGAALLRLLWKLTSVDIHVEQVENRYEVAIDGTLTFAGVPKLITKLGKIPTGAEVHVDLALRYLDHAGFEALHSWQDTHEKLGGVVHLEHLEEIWSRGNGRSKRSASVQAVEATA